MVVLGRAENLSFPYPRRGLYLIEQQENNNPLKGHLELCQPPEGFPHEDLIL